MPIIKDELYGTIEISETEKCVIDSEEFQRLHRIKQMALTYLVYPSATHTRFEHSLGTMHLTSVICSKLGVENEEKEKIRLFALLHDIGHTAFSHESEVILKKYLGDHEHIGRTKILKGEIADILSENYSPKEIMEMENKPEGMVVTSDLGADRMDYLKRDAQNTGVAYGVIDVDRIVHMLTMEKNELCIREGGLASAESLLIARYMMFATVYMHKTVRIAAAMLQKAIETAIESKELEPEFFLTASDEEALLTLSKMKSSNEYANRLIARRLYKEASVFDVGKTTPKEAEQLEKKLVKENGFDVLVAYPPKIFKPVDLKVKTDEALVPMIEISDIVKALKMSGEKRKIIVACSNENLGKIKK